MSDGQFPWHLTGKREAITGQVVSADLVTNKRTGKAEPKVRLLFIGGEEQFTLKYAHQLELISRGDLVRVSGSRQVIEGGDRAGMNWLSDGVVEMVNGEEITAMVGSRPVGATPTAAGVKAAATASNGEAKR